MGALGLISQEKLDTLEVKDLSKVAKDMASVYGALNDKSQSSGPPINLVVYSPEIKSEAKYKVFDV